MRIKWMQQFRGTGPRGLEIFIYKGEDGNWYWELTEEDDCNILAQGCTYDWAEAKLQSTNAMRNVLQFERSELHTI